MREIKYRCWDKNQKQFVESGDYNADYAISFGGKVLESTDNCGRGAEYREYMTDEESQNYVLMQYTGLKDSNGKEIYEGDIVVFDTEHDSATGQIEWVDNGFWIKDKHGGNYLPNTDNREIIGNIHQHPELLEKEIQEV